MDDNIPLMEVTNQTVTDVSGRETLIVNVGGVIFETYRSTLSQTSNGPLVDNNILEEHFRPERNDYFFDRDPDAFKIFVNTLRTGKITIQPGINDPTLKNELLFWGLMPDVNQLGNANLTQTPINFEENAHAGISCEGTIREGIGNKIWNILSNPSTSFCAKLYAGLSYFLICLSVVVFVAETTPPFPASRPGGVNLTQYEQIRELKTRLPDTRYAGDIVALVCCLFFIIEYILRFVVAPNRLRFVLSFLGVIDLLAVLPEIVLFLLSFIFDNLLSIFRLLRILGIFRILRILRMFKHFNKKNRGIIIRTIQSSLGELVILVSIMAIGVLIWGTLAYFADDSAGDDYKTGFKTIPEACWWAIVTMTTVGYGDIMPLTPFGKALGSLCAMSGLLLIGLFVSVLMNNMIKVCSK